VRVRVEVAADAVRLHVTDEGNGLDPAAAPDPTTPDNVGREDGRGLFVRGLVSGETVAGKAALELIHDGRMNGLSIGFIARDWAPRPFRGRDLREIELREISLVSSPMLPDARFQAVGGRVGRRAA
jgi:hypothetical protein